MIDCTFELNNEPMSKFKCYGFAFPAFSGSKNYVNKRSAACVAGVGPIPPRTYYIVDRESGGRLAALRDLWHGRTDWFALYADDGIIDDVTFCDKVARGEFRLHSKGMLGISKGCIAINEKIDFYRLRDIFKSTNKIEVEGSVGLFAYGKVHAW